MNSPCTVTTRPLQSGILCRSGSTSGWDWTVRQSGGEVGGRQGCSKAGLQGPLKASRRYPGSSRASWGAFGAPALFVLCLTSPGGSDTCLRAEPCCEQTQLPSYLMADGPQRSLTTRRNSSCRAVTLSTSSRGEEAATLCLLLWEWKNGRCVCVCGGV